MNPGKKRLNIFLISDATGTTAESVMTSVLVQFPEADTEIRRFPFVRTMEQLEEIVKMAPLHEAIIVFTLVSKKLRKALKKKGKERGLTVVDVMGPLFKSLTHILDQTPTKQPGLLQQSQTEMYRVTEAIHYTLMHDDGQGLDTIEQADLIIFGVSRTGKTPTSIYLSCRKLKVANVPIILDIPLPRNLMRNPIKKVGFSMGMERLMQLRTERVGRMNRAAIPGYSSKGYILKEQDYCEKLFRQFNNFWALDVTERSIEETSEWITHTVLGS